MQQQDSPIDHRAWRATWVHFKKLPTAQLWVNSINTILFAAMWLVQMSCLVMVDGRMRFVQQVLFPNCCELETGSWVEAGIYVVKACSVWRPNCLQVPTRQNLKLEVENYHLDLLWLLPLQSLGQSAIQPLYHRVEYCCMAFDGIVGLGPYHNNSFTARFHTFLPSLWAWLS